MTQEDLAKVVRLHGMWLRGEAGGIRANLRGADLSSANLSGANLRDANLSDANLSCANLCDANLPLDHPVSRLDFGRWSVCITKENTQIGCQKHPNEYWLGWDSDSPEIAAMHEDAPSWWATHGEAVKAAIRCVMAKAEAAVSKA